MTKWHGGKGSKVRPTDKQKYDNNYDIAFSKKFIIEIDEYQELVRIGWIFEGDYLIDSATGLTIGKKIDIDGAYYIVLYEKVLETILSPTYYYEAEQEIMIAYNSVNMLLYEYSDSANQLLQHRKGKVYPSNINYLGRYKNV